MNKQLLKIAETIIDIEENFPEGNDIDLKAEDLSNSIDEAIWAICDCITILKEVGMDNKDAQNKILNFIHNEICKERIPGGFADGKPDSEFDSEQLEKGIRVELEHTGDIGIAKEIAKDHLVEIPDDYYDRLEEMEEEAEKEGKTNNLADETVD